MIYNLIFLNISKPYDQSRSWHKTASAVGSVHCVEAGSYPQASLLHTPAYSFRLRLLLQILQWRIVSHMPLLQSNYHYLPLMFSTITRVTLLPYHTHKLAQILPLQIYKTYSSFSILDFDTPDPSCSQIYFL